MLQNNAEIEAYIREHSDKEEDLLKELTRQTYLKEVYPGMISGHIQGKLLEMLSKMMRPRQILEIGTFTGYSALCLSRGLQPDGSLHTIEKNDELEKDVNYFFQKAEIQDYVTLHIGNALEIIPHFNVQFDLVFIDGDKKEYPDYYRCLIPKLAPGGVLIADNVLWYGKVVEEQQKNDKETAGIKQFNELAKKDEQLEKLMLPIRDGLFLMRKKEDAVSR